MSKISSKSKVLIIVLATSLPFSSCFSFPKEDTSAVIETINKIPEEVEAQTQLVVLRNAKKLEGCYTRLWRGRKLGEKTIKRTQVSSSLRFCQKACDLAALCTAFSFGFLNSNRTDGRCEMTDLKTEFQSSANWDTTTSPHYDVYLRHEYCPEQRILTKNSNSPVLAVDPYPLYPAKQYYETNTLDKPATQPPAPAARQGAVQTEGCYTQALSSRKLANRYIRISKTTYNLADCEDLCTREKSFDCLGFSYREPQTAGEVLNCDLTDQDTRTLDQYDNYDFYQSSNTDFYERSRSGVNCGRDSSSGSSGSKCYSSFKSSYKHYTYRDYKTSSSVAGCAEECKSTSWCNSISYRYSYNSVTDIGNCLLSDTRVEDLRDPEDLVKDSSWDIFRINLGASCSSTNGNNYPQTTSSPSTASECYRRDRTSYRLADLVTADRRTTNSLESCSQLCSDRASCNSLSYRSSGLDPDGHNCYLSAVEVNTLTNQDLVYDDDWSIYKNLPCGNGSPSADGLCHARERVSYKISSYAISGRRFVATVTDCSKECQTESSCNSFAFRYSSSSGSSSSDNCLLSDQDVSSLVSEDNLVVDQDWDLYARLESGYNCRSTQNDCYKIEHSLYRHYTTVARETLDASSLADCSSKCREKSFCNTFSYGDTSTRNCLLSALRGRDIVVNEDLVSDQYWSVYANIEGNSGQCRAGSPTNPTANSDCYRQDRTGYKYYNSVVREAVSARAAQDCSERCHQASYCRSFTFRPEPYLATKNCFLSELSVANVKQNLDLLQDSDWTLYESLDGRNCVGSNNVKPSGTRCYSKERPGYKYYSTVVRDVVSVDTLALCAEKCGREDFCKSFSYRFSQYNDQDNCLLSSLNTDKILAQSDLVADQDWDIWQHKCKNQDNADWVIREKASKLAGSAVDTTSAVSSLEACHRRCEDTRQCKTFAFSDQGYTNCQISRLSFSNLGRFDLVKDAKWDVYELKDSSDGSIYFPTQPTTQRPSLAEKCYKRSRTGFRHYSGSYREHSNVRDVLECSNECGRKTFCNTFSYRYFVSDSSTDNCLLSDLPTPVANEILTDSNWDIYTQLRNSQCASSTSTSILTEDTALGRNDTDRADQDNCAESARDGYRHFSTPPKDKLKASSLYDCGSLCRRETYCNSFSYSKYGRDCYLSSLRVDELQTRDTTYDRDWNIFRPLFGGSCSSGNGGGGGGSGGGGGGGGYYPDNPYNPGQGTQRPSGYRPPQRPTDNRPLKPDSLSGCFRIYEARYRLERSAARESVSARDLRDCEDKCEEEHLFTCRSFSFTSGYTARNCDLSELGARDLSLGRDLVRDSTSDVYEKKTTGTCGTSSGGGNVIHDYIRCSNFAEPSYQLSYSITRELASARDSADCEEQCLLATRFACKIFAYKYGSSGYKNCELSDRDFRDIQLRTDLDPNSEWDVFERTRYSGECRDKSGAHGNGDSIIIDRLSCYTKYRSDTSFRARAVVETRPARDEEECARECDYFRGKGQYECSAFSFRRDFGSYSDNCLLSDSYGRNIDVDLEYERDYSVYEFSGRGQNCRNNENEVGLAGEYTVNGQRCLRGGCRLNPDVNYWYCEIEEDRGWDYCCRPEHRCGYSEGFSYPWCFVGEAGYDQWRPCDSERARTGDRRSGYDSYGRPLYAYLHEDSPPKQVHPDGRVDHVAAPVVPSVPFNSNNIPFMSINEHRIDNTNFAPAKEDAARPFSRRSDHGVAQEEIEDNFISNAKVVEIDMNDTRVNSKMLPFLAQQHGMNATLN